MTLNEMIEIIKAENPTIRIGDDDTKYTELTGTDYDLQIKEWAENRLAKLEKLAEIETAKIAKIEAIQKLVALGIDPKALGLVTEEPTPMANDEADTL